MVDYEQLYRVLFNGIVDAIEDIEKYNYGSARLTLIKAEQAAEDIFLESDESNPVLRLLARPDEGAAGGRQE